MFRILIPSITSGVSMFFAGQYLAQNQSNPSQIKPQPSLTSKTSQQQITLPFRLIQYPHYNILYSTYHKSPLAVHEIITKTLIQGNAPRSKFFFSDENIFDRIFQVDQSYFYQTEAYKRFNVNRGHMAAAGNYSGQESQKFHTFAFTNVIPQNGYNNGGIWNTFERYSRKLVENEKCESVEIISGPIYIKNNPFDKQALPNKSYRSKLIVLKQNGIPIPQKLYKIIKCNTKTGTYFDAFQFLNSQTYDNEKKLQQFKIPLKSVELQTGLTFNLTGKSLTDFDPNTLTSKKQQLDHQFFFGLMKNSTQISEMNDGFRRAKQQKIFIELQKLTEKIRQLAQSQIKGVVDNQLGQCQKMKKLLTINKNIYALHHLSKTKDIRQDSMKIVYQKCLLKSAQNVEQMTTLQKLKESYGEDLQALFTTKITNS